MRFFVAEIPNSQGFKKKKKVEEDRKDKKIENREERKQKIERNRKQQNNIRISQFAAEQHIIINE